MIDLCLCNSREFHAGFTCSDYAGDDDMSTVHRVVDFLVCRASSCVLNNHFETVVWFVIEKTIGFYKWFARIVTITTIRAPYFVSLLLSVALS